MQVVDEQNWYWKGGLFSRPSRNPGMIGRQREQRQIFDFLESDRTALHLVGIGGMGKSYLARWLAWEGRGDRSIAWVECSRCSVTVEGLMNSIASAANHAQMRELLSNRREPLSVGDNPPIRDCVDLGIEALDQAHCILVLEDFHDLDNTAQVEYQFLRPAVQSMQFAKIVIVSRRFAAILDEPELRVFQERLPLSGLTREDTLTLLAARGLNLPSPALFESLWKKTGHGIPRIVELAATQLRDDPEPEKRVERLPVYQSGDMRVWLDQQIQDLRARTRKFLTTLLPLRKPEHIAFCRQLWQSEDFDSRLNALRSWCLLDPSDDPDSILISNLFREYMLEEKIPASERLQLHDQTAGVYLSEAKRAKPADRADLLVEAIWHADQAQDTDLVLEAGAMLQRMPEIEKNLDLLGQVDRLVVQAARQSDDKLMLVNWLLLYGNRLRLGNELSAAVSALQEADLMASQHCDASVQIQTAFLLAAAYYSQGRYADANTTYEHCLRLAKEMQDVEKELQILPELGTTQLRVNHVAEAETTLVDCLNRAEEQQQQGVKARTLCKLARLYLKHKGDTVAPEKALRYLEEAYRIFASLDDQAGTAETLGLLGDASRYKKDTANAYEYYRKAREIERCLGLRAQEAISVGQMAFLARDCGNYREALRLSEESLGLSERLGNDIGKQIQMVLRGELHLIFDEKDAALRDIMEARAIASNPHQQQPIGIASADRALAKYYKAVGKPLEAKESLERALEGYVRTNSFQYAAETWSLAAPIFQEWAAASRIETIVEEFERAVYDEAVAYRLERVVLLAELLLDTLQNAVDPSHVLMDICSGLELREVPDDRWHPNVLRFCLEHWIRLAPSVLERAIAWAATEQLPDFYVCWIAAAIRERDPLSFDAILKKIREEHKFSFENKFALLEPLEPELAPHSDLQQQLAEIYFNGIVLEIDRSLRNNRPLPAYTRDVHRALHYLDSASSQMAKDYIVDELQRAKDEARVQPDFELLPPEISLDLTGKRVALIGGQPSVRRLVAEDIRKRFNLQDLREVPPSWEQHVNTKIMREAIADADLIVIIWRCLDHASSYALNAVLGDEPHSQRVRNAPGSGRSSIVRTIQEYFA